ncbi:LysM peptidoglycan-binding domain-containing protein [Methylobacterium sp.]|uniref:LysM peptidoglycan-binding domain-containing protein n=1 Tax=Methylobacterium sp. TaxID=409 RepID=UPI002602E95C|nr:LysM peptidoglycan-binding domain-containing protein [Methylobacterium sp.]MDB5645792.1 hypothetical protein [Methylobacterium sp.]
MRAELRRSIFLACVGLLAGFALVVTLYGAGTLFKRGLGTPVGLGSTDGTLVPPAGAPAQDPKAEDTKAEDTKAIDPTSANPKTADPKTPAAPAPRPGEGAASTAGKPLAALEAPPAPDRGPPLPRSGEAPSFDIIRIEPNGEAVIAGRAAPNTTVELLRDNAPIARALVDPSGQFALVPPALPTGNSEITLRVIGADGRISVSRDSVAVVVAANRAAKPLIALTSPDKPTIVLSQPDAAAPATDTAGRAKPPGGQLATTMPGDGTRPGVTKPAPGTTPAQPGRPGEAVKPAETKPGSEAAASDKAAAVKIVSVEAEDGGRLYVTSQAQPGATVRLYLNDTLVAPGSAGPDGRVTFTIGRGVQPGDYKIRVDQVDPVSGKVKTRSEVAFAVPVAVAKPPAKASPDAASAAPDRVAGLGARPAPVARPRTPEPPALPPATVPKAPGDVSRQEPVKQEPVKQEPVRQAARDPATPRDSGTPTAQADAPARSAEAVTSGGAAMAPPVAPATPPEGPRTVFVPEIGTARIVRGDSLWQISRRIYGKGTRYTVIFDANQPQIRNPDLIYPGQIFVLPSDGSAAVPQDGTRG